VLNRFKIQKTLFFMVLCAYLFAPVQAISGVQPQVDSNLFPYFDPNGSGSAGPDPNATYPATPSYFPLELGKTKAEIQALLDFNNEITAFPSFEFGPSIYTYQLFTHGDIQVFQAKVDIRIEGPGRSGLPKSQLPDPVGLYFLKNGVSIGYCVIDPMKILLPHKFEPYLHINRLPQEKNYLQGELVSDPIKNLAFFSVVRQDGYTERYATLTMKMNPQELSHKAVYTKDNILVRSFYPTELENLVQPYLKEALNEHLQKYGSWASPYTE